MSISVFSSLETPSAPQEKKKKGGGVITSCFFELEIADFNKERLLQECSAF